MTPHYDLKQQEKNNGVLGAGLVCVGGWGVTNIFVIYLGGGQVCFSNGIGGGGSSKLLPTKCNRPPHLVINDSSLKRIKCLELKDKNLGTKQTRTVGDIPTRDNINL